MAIIRGCNLPEDLYYYPEKHLWLKPLGGNLFRLGLTPIAASWPEANSMQSPSGPKTLALKSPREKA